MRQILTRATTALLLLAVSLNALPEQLAEAQRWSEHRASPEGQLAFEAGQSHAWNIGQTPEPAHHFVGGSSSPDPGGQTYKEDETDTGPDQETYASGAISRVYRSSRSYGGSDYSSRRSYSPDIGVSIHYRHSYPGYQHRSYREHQYGHGLRHYRQPGYGSKYRRGGYSQHHGYHKPRRYGHGFRHGYRGSLHHRSGSGHSHFGGSGHIRR